MQRFFPQLAINGSHEILDTLTRIVQSIIDYPDGSILYGNHIAKLDFVNYEKK